MIGMNSLILGDKEDYPDNDETPTISTLLAVISTFQAIELQLMPFQLNVVYFCKIGFLLFSTLIIYRPRQFSTKGADCPFSLYLTVKYSIIHSTKSTVHYYFICIISNKKGKRMEFLEWVVRIFATLRD